MSYVISLAQKNIVYSKDREWILPNQNQNRRVVVFPLILLIILFSVLNIIQVNSVATGGYEIQKYKSEIAELQSGNKNLELKLLEVQAPGFLEEKIEGLNMIKAEKIDYLSAVSEVAAR